MSSAEYPPEEARADLHMYRDASITVRLARAERILRRIAEDRRGDTKKLFIEMARRTVADSDEWWGRFWHHEASIPPWYKGDLRRAQRSSSLEERK